uniref:Microtubule associated protein 9 n=1 Tax=Propithecus coquereli TaxID=379532 RepID=A0A2K6ESY3_PROCO
MSDEVFSTTLAYTKSPRVTKRTTFQDELIRAITARSARQRSSEYSEDFDSDEIVSLGDFSDTSVDENSFKKKVNDFHISDDEEKNSPRLSFLKTRKSNSDITKDEPVCTTKNDEEMAPDGCEDVAVNSLSESQNKDQDIEKEKIKVRPKPRILPIKILSSAENSSSFETDDHFKPSPRPRSMLKKNSHVGEKDSLEEDKKTTLNEELELHSAPSSLPRLNDRQLEAEKKAFSENFAPEDACLTSLSSSSLKESLEDSFSPGSEGKASIKGDLVTTAFEKSKDSQVTDNDLEEEKEKAELSMNDDLTVDPLLPKSQSILISTNATESAKKTIEDRNVKNDKSTNNRASSASGRCCLYYMIYSHILGSEWLEKKNVYLHELHRIKRIESENLRIQNEQKRAAKREEALASFEAWKAMKEKEAKKIAAKKRLEEKNKKKTEEENAVRKGEAQQVFEIFEYLYYFSHLPESSPLLFSPLEMLSPNSYHKWLLLSIMQERIERKQKKRHSFLENEALPPWSPPSRTVFSKVF